MVRNISSLISSINHPNCPTRNPFRWKTGQGRYPTNSRRRGSSETFVLSEPRSCWTCRLNYPHRESIKTGSSWMALTTRSIYESQHCIPRSSQGNGDLVFRRKYVHGMEVNRFRVATVGSWKTCAPVLFRLSAPTNNDVKLPLFEAGSGKSILWFVDNLLIFINDN